MRDMRVLVRTPCSTTKTGKRWRRLTDSRQKDYPNPHSIWHLLYRRDFAFDNNKYNPIGQNLELEVNNTIGISISISEIVVLDGYLFNQMLEAVEKGDSPVLTLDGVVEGRDGSQERITYRDCIFSGDNDLQNVSTGDFLKRSYNLHCNGRPERRSSLTI